MPFWKLSVGQWSTGNTFGKIPNMEKSIIAVGGCSPFFMSLTFRTKILNRNYFKCALLLVWPVFFAMLQKISILNFYLHHFLRETSERIV